MEDRIKHIFDFMEYDELTDAQHGLVVSFEDQFKRSGRLSEKQFDIEVASLEKAAGTVRRLR